jgi:hypothetical protein
MWVSKKAQPRTPYLIIPSFSSCHEFGLLVSVCLLKKAESYGKKIRQDRWK